MSLLERVRTETAEALKHGNTDRVRVLRVLSSELQKAQKESGAEPDEVAVLRRELKRRREAAEAYRSGGRDDLAASEEREAQAIEGYLPAQLSDDELEAMVADAIAEVGASSANEMGKVMSVVMPRVQGRADGKRVSALVREKLSP